MMLLLSLPGYDMPATLQVKPQDRDPGSWITTPTGMATLQMTCRAAQTVQRAVGERL